MSTTTEKAEWVSAVELAAILSISRSSVFAWIKRTPRVKAMRRYLGARTIRYPRSKVLEFVAKHGAETAGAS